MSTSQYCSSGMNTNLPEFVCYNDVHKVVSVDFSTKENFLALFKELVDEMERGLNSNGYDLPSDSIEYIKHMMEYNIPKGKLTRGLTVVNTYKVLKPGCTLSDIKRVAIFGWCMEWIQAAFLVADDIMDNSITRRGQPCWFRNKAVGMIAINDAFILLIQTEVLLHKYLGHDPKMFKEVHSLFISTIYRTEMGQNLDLSTQPPGSTGQRLDLTKYTSERYDKIVQYKTAYYSVYAPIALGMILAGNYNYESLARVQQISLRMGRYFQIQDDYLDVYGDPDVIGKIGTDIQDGKCSWLIVQALGLASDDQKLSLQMSYGKESEEAISNVKSVFSELELNRKYEEYEEKVYAELKAEIEESQDVVPSIIFTAILEKIYRRNK